MLPLRLVGCGSYGEIEGHRCRCGRVERKEDGVWGGSLRRLEAAVRPSVGGNATCSAGALESKRGNITAVGGLGRAILAAQHSQLREPNVACQEESRARNQAKLTCIEDILSLLALRSPPVTTSTRYSSHPPTLKHRALLAHAILLPKEPDFRKELRRLRPEGLPPVDVHLSSADQIPFAVARYRCGWVATRGVGGSVGGNMLPMR